LILTSSKQRWARSPRLETKSQMLMALAVQWYSKINLCGFQAVTKVELFRTQHSLALAMQRFWVTLISVMIFRAEFPSKTQTKTTKLEAGKEPSMILRSMAALWPQWAQRQGQTLQ
jgi:hypothetical protein